MNKFNQCVLQVSYEEFMTGYYKYHELCESCLEETAQGQLDILAAEIRLFEANGTIVDAELDRLNNTEQLAVII